MSPNPTPRLHPDRAHNARPERRTNRRYNMELELRCASVRTGLVLCGKTRDISSHGVRFEVQRDFPPGALVELSILWPFRLEDVCNLQLKVLGRVVRSDGSETAIRILRHELRTRGIAA